MSCRWPPTSCSPGTEVLGRLALERMLGGLSTRRYPLGLEPVGTQVEQAASGT